VIWICIVWDFIFILFFGILVADPKLGATSKLPSLEKIAVFGL
jgi:hypothetical protein